MELRPIRLGLVIAPDSVDGLVRAIAAASISWGGQTFPILQSDETPDTIKRLAVLLGLDALVACDEDPRSQEIAAMDGFSWMGYGSVIDFDKYGDRLASLATVLPAIRTASPRDEPPPLVAWDDRDEFDLLLSVLYGRIGSSSDYEREAHDTLATSLGTVDVPPDSLAPPTTPRRAGPLELGMWSVRQWSHLEHGIAVIDPSSVPDLINFWNLRAVGKVVLPWPEPFNERVAAFTRAQLSSLPLDRWGDEGNEHTTVFTTDHELPSTLRTLLDAEHRESVMLSFFDLESHAHGGAAIGSEFTSYFDIGVVRSERGATSARVPLPRIGMKLSNIAHGRQFYAARVSIHSESGLADRVSFRAPSVRQLSKALVWAISDSKPVVRGVGDGVVVACSVSSDEDELVLGAVDAVGLIHRLLELAGFQTKVSDAGRWSTRIVDMLGGAASTLASQPAVRAVLDLAAREGGANAEELHNAARRLAGPWEERSLLWLRRTPYHRWVVGVLAAQKTIEAHLTYTCSACGLLQRMAPEQIKPTLACNDCDHETPLSLEVILGARWRLTTRRLLTQKRLRSCLPIAASLSLLGQVQRRGDSANLHYALGLDLERGGEKFEIDYAVLLQDEDGAVLVVGESKGRNDFSDDDISNLEAVQDAVRSLGVECFIAVSNSKSALTEAEVARLRASADRFLFGINDGRGGGHLNLPLVLTKRALTLPEMHAAHPITVIGHHRSSIGELARWSSQEELGLDGYGDLRTRTLTWKAPAESPTGGKSPA